MKLPFFKSKPSGTTVTFQLDGLHCTSCSLNIDGALEELSGVFSASTSYRTQQTVVSYDAKKVSPSQLQKTIEELGYQIINDTKSSE